MVDSDKISGEFAVIQDEICAALEQLDGKGKFIEDTWERPGGGGGRSRVLSHGDLIEKGGVNYSKVFGSLPEVMLKELGAENPEFLATGVSIVLHPNNPFVPIIHMNIRYFEMGDGTYWFGGGIDLTPHYIDKTLATSFHQKLKRVCDTFHPDFYPDFKKWADDYFYIPHRNETRGVGGIFFDKLNHTLSKEALFEFVCQVGRTFVDCYSEPASAGRDKSYTDEHKQWQQLRRGRYVEFNLVYDRGTRFGLQTSGRIESILMSLPETAGWLYNHSPKSGSPEFETQALLRKGIDWIG